MRVLFVSDTHLGLDLPTRPRVVRRRRGYDFFENFDRALEPARRGDVDVVVHGGDLLYRSHVPAWLAEAALAPLKHLASSGMPVLLVPGNHERGRMPYPLLALHQGLHLFDRPRSVVVEARGVRAAFIGFPYTGGIRHRFRDVLAAAVRDTPSADARVLCIHQCVEGATCGPGNFTFRSGADVIRTADLPRDAAVTLSGHIHRHQVLRPAGRAPVIYAGSVERTSFAEAPETKGYVVLELTRSGLGAVEFHPLPARPMVLRSLSFDGLDDVEAHARVAAAIGSTPADAVVQLQVRGVVPAALSAAALRAIAGARNVTLACRAADRLNTRKSPLVRVRAGAPDTRRLLPLEGLGRLDPEPTSCGAEGSEQPHDAHDKGRAGEEQASTSPECLSIGGTVDEERHSDPESHSN
jgi:DNA repair exonuclease SbcCD nuclease subunit